MMLTATDKALAGVAHSHVVLDAVDAEVRKFDLLCGPVTVTYVNRDAASE
jgi:hypothetical protein